MSREIPTETRSADVSVRFGAVADTSSRPTIDAASATSIVSDPEKARELDRLLTVARELRPLLRDEQGATEERGCHSADVHSVLWSEGFYRILQPSRYGGLQLGVAAFFRVIAELARGCPSTAWAVSLGAGHALQLGSYFSEQAQAEVFGQHGQAVIPASGGGKGTVARRVTGGYLLEGTWRYCSGSSYSTHFVPTFLAPGSDGSPAPYWGIVDRSDYEVLDDWGVLPGMRGSGSHSIKLDRVFVPEYRTVPMTFNFSSNGHTIGSRLHGDSTYAGVFRGVAEGEIAAVAVGLAYAALDELERILTTSYLRGSERTKSTHLDYQRALGLAFSSADAAAAVSIRGGQLYEDYARRSVTGIEDFGSDKSFRLASSYFRAEELAWEAVDRVIRTGGSSATATGTRLERYLRDILTVRTRADQLDFDASAAGAAVISNHLVSEPSPAP